MGPALGDLHPTVPDAVDQTVGVVDAAAPPSAEIALQGLRFADAGVAVPVHVLEQLVDPLIWTGRNSIWTREILNL